MVADMLRPVTDPSPSRVLVVDDEPTVREVVASYLQREGYEVAVLADGGTVIDAIEQFRPDLLVLDVMLPVRSGFDLVRDLRTRTELPVILLTARSDETDRVLGLELGADDYIVKPFSPRELAARVRGVLRRTRVPVTAATTASADRLLEFDRLKIDVIAREVLLDGEVIGLTAKEFDLLAHLASHPRRAFSRAELLREVWDSDPGYQDPATVTVHVRRVRTKLDLDPHDPRWIVTVFGVGYRFEP
jgi:DNA-binding response OmpR family regulator